MILNASQIAELESIGYLIFDNVNQNDLISFADVLGLPKASRPGRTLIDIITPKEKNLGRKNTLSSYFGLDLIPFHSDGAYLSMPPKFVILYYQGTCDSSNSTLLKDLTLLEFSKPLELDLQRQLFTVRDKNKDFYTSIINVSNKRKFYRYNPICMKPTNDAAVEANRRFDQNLSKLPVISVPFSNNRLLIFNNWRYLHGRNQINLENGAIRSVHRIFVFEVEE